MADVVCGGGRVAGGEKEVMVTRILVWSEERGEEHEEKILGEGGRAGEDEGERHWRRSGNGIRVGGRHALVRAMAMACGCAPI